MELVKAGSCSLSFPKASLNLTVVKHQEGWNREWKSTRLHIERNEWESEHTWSK